MEQNNLNPNRGLKAVILGSTGVIGRFLVRELCRSKKWVEVAVIVRRKLNEWDNMQGAQKLKIIEVGSLDELQETEKWIQFRNYDSFFCTLGSRTKEGKIKQKQLSLYLQFYKVDFTQCFWGAQIAEHNKIPHFSLLSSVGANTNSRFFSLKIKGQQAIQAIKDLNFRYYSIFQPGIIKNIYYLNVCQPFFQIKGFLIEKMILDVLKNFFNIFVVVVDPVLRVQTVLGLLLQKQKVALAVAVNNLIEQLHILMIK